MMIPHQGELAALGTAFCWTVTAMAFEAAGHRVGSLAVNLIRLLFAAVFLAFFGLILRGLPLPTDASVHAWVWLSLSGVVGFAVGDLALFRALVVIGPRLSTLIMSLAPIVAALLGWVVLGERMTHTHLLGMGLTLFGVAWVVLERKPSEKKTPPGTVAWIGVGLAFVGAVGQGGGLVLSKLGMKEYDPFAATQIRVFAGIVSFSVLFCFLRWWPRVRAAVRNPQAMGYTALGAFFGPFLGVSLSLMAVQYISTGVAQTIMAVVPVLIIPFVILVNKERVSFRAVAGAVLAVGGVAILFLF